MTSEASYYSDKAFRSTFDRPTERAELSAFRKLNKQSLSWGDTKNIFPDNIFAKETPKRLRMLEKKPDLLKEIGFEGCFDHGCIRYARLSAFSAFVNFINIVAKVGFWAIFPLSLIASLIAPDAFDGTKEEVIWKLAEVPIMMAAVTLIPWLGTSLLIQLFPKFFIRSGKGPEWELNRRTGMVKIWTYPRKLPFRKRGRPEVVEERFTEFSPWISALGDRHGALYRLEFFHRKKDIEAYVGDFLLPQRHPVMCYAYWHFLQNYMDITKPLPDIPILEQYRHLDPVTAEYDRKTKRPDRYWRDMDDETWKEKKREVYEKTMACRQEV